jgi:photosystem II stability/assembly factor-like uncharacterized protein
MISKLTISLNKKKDKTMKTNFILMALVVTFLTTVTHSQLNDNWKWLNPSPQGNTLNAVDFVDNNTGYSAGVYGTLLKTTDGGAGWEQLNSGTAKNLMSMCFVNAATGYVGGPSQLLRKTTDAGNTWQNLVLPVQGNWDTAYYVMDINFVNQNTGYVIGFFLLESKIWKTTDGGSTWSTQTTGGANYLKKSYFLDENTGFAYGGPAYSEVIKTTNGGSSWQSVSQESYIAYSMSFINATTGVYGCADGRVYRAVDGGNTWNFALCPSSLDITSIQFINATTGFGFGTGSVYIKTTDAGQTWDELPIGTGSINQYYDADMTANGNLHAVGTYGAMIRSTNSGTSFVSQPFVTEHSITDIEFINVTTGYAVAGFGEGDILKTTDAGETWVSQVSSYTLPLYGIAFTSPETGYLAGSINIKKTTNGGTNWSDVYTSNQNEIFGDVFFTNVNTGYVVGSYGKLLKTTNAGATWNSTTIPNVGTFLNSIYFVNDNTGFVVGGESKALKTTDAGATWSVMNVTSGFLSNNNVFFTDINTGYISHGTGIFKTTNSGSTWFQLSTPSGGYNNVQFRNNYGYAIAGDGKIIKSIDGGNSWIVQPTVTSNSLYALYFNSDNFVYAGGVRGNMMKTIPQELLVTPISGNTNEVPETFYLQQNYPNPFNPVTTIKFGLTKPGMVNIKVYDITGKIVEELISSNYNPGSYDVKWDAAKYSSGVYFYTIVTNEFAQTKKMVLVK